MYPKTVQECLKEVSFVTKAEEVAYVHGWNAAINNKATFTGGYVACNCGKQSVVHFCQQCLKDHAEYCRRPF